MMLTFCIIYRVLLIVCFLPFHFSLHPSLFLLLSFSLWRQLSSPALKGLEVTFNKCLRRICNLPANTHTGILHCHTGFNSIFNTVFARASKFLDRAATSSNYLVRAVFQSSRLYTFAGFNDLFGSIFMKQYSSDDV